MLLCTISVTSGFGQLRPGCNWNSTQNSNFSKNIFYVIRHFIQVIFENLVEGLFLKSFCEHLGGVPLSLEKKKCFMLDIPEIIQHCYRRFLSTFSYKLVLSSFSFATQNHNRRWNFHLHVAVYRGFFIAEIRNMKGLWSKFKKFKAISF